VGLGSAHARAFDIDVLACLRCGGRLRLVALVEDPGAVCAILSSLRLTAEESARASPSVAETRTASVRTITA